MKQYMVNVNRKVDQKGVRQHRVKDVSRNV